MLQITVQCVFSPGPPLEKPLEDKYRAQWPKPKYMSEPREMVYVRDGGDGAYRQKTYVPWNCNHRWVLDGRVSGGGY